MRQTLIALLLLFALPAVAGSVDDLTDKIALLKMEVSTMQTELSTMRMQISDLESQVSKQVTEISTLQMQVTTAGSRRNRISPNVLPGSGSESK